MKVRSGFVSNSSSSSFVVISKEDISPDADCVTPPRLVEDTYRIVEIPEGTSYCREDIKLLNTLDDKLKFLVAMYAYAYQHEEAKIYSTRMLACQYKLAGICSRYGFYMAIHTPPLRGDVGSILLDDYYRDCKRNKDTHSSSNINEIIKTVVDSPQTSFSTYINVSTECHFISEMVDLVENENTTKLESYLFNPHSFCVIGGDEYLETSRIAYKMKQYVKKEGYEYLKFGDDAADHEIGDPCSWSESGVYDYAYHWGEYKPKSRLAEKLENIYNNIGYKLFRPFYRLKHRLREFRKTKTGFQEDDRGIDEI